MSMSINLFGFCCLYFSEESQWNWIDLADTYSIATCLNAAYTVDQRLQHSYPWFKQYVPGANWPHKYYQDQEHDYFTYLASIL